MKKFITGLLISALMLVSIALAGPAEKKLHKEGYGKIVYDLISTNAAGEKKYGQGTAIGPHYILTASHIVVTKEDVLPSIEVCTKRRDSLGGPHILIKAVVVAAGDVEDLAKDWAIIKTEKKLKYWKALEFAKAEIGDDVYNISGRYLLYGAPFRITVIAIDPILLGKGYVSKKVKVYVTTPRTQGGDSGSPVFNENGKIIGIVVAGNERITIIVKAKTFSKKLKKYRGQ